MYDVTARRHAQDPAGEPVDAGKPSPVAAKAAAIDAAQARPLTWKTVVMRALAVGVAGVALYLVLPKLIAVLGAWPRLSTLNPAWFTACLAAELVAFTCNFALQRLALGTKDWFPVVTAGLAGNAVTNSLPVATRRAPPSSFRMLTTAGFATDTAVGGLTAFSLLGVGGLLAAWRATGSGPQPSWRCSPTPPPASSRCSRSPRAGWAVPCFLLPQALAVLELLQAST
jgi:hypothetical protein